jgi:hypothetical protein
MPRRQQCSVVYEPERMDVAEEMITLPPQIGKWRRVIRLIVSTPRMRVGPVN